MWLEKQMCQEGSVTSASSLADGAVGTKFRTHFKDLKNKSGRKFTGGFLRVVAHEAKPTSLLLTVAKEVKEAHLLQVGLQTVQVLQQRTSVLSNRK